LKRAWQISLSILCVSLLLAACASTREPSPDMVPPPPDRQREISSLFDRLHAEDQSVAASAADELAAGSDQDRRFVASLWATRTRHVIAARRYGQALSRAGLHEDAAEWYERGLLEGSADSEKVHWMRYELARSYVALGREADAVNMLLSHRDTTPLSQELREHYDDLLEEIKTG
jgi:tetratricopeptide (TPR) repeat protein